MKESSYPLGVVVTDIATNRTGMLTTAAYEGSGRVSYLFQPNGLNTKTRRPLKRSYIGPGRISTNLPLESIEIPIEVLGTKVKDKASGYEGIAVQIIRMMNGCIHITVQSSDTTEDGEIVDPCEFSILQLEGKAIKPFSPAEVKKEKKDRPSPLGDELPITPFAAQ